MKLKLDDKGNVVVQDGKPVYVHDDGKEIAFDAAATVAKIAQLNGEAKGHREEKEAAQASLKAFAGIEDPAKALKALEIVKNLDDKKLLDAGEVQKIKDATEAAYAEKLKAQEETYKPIIAERDTLKDSLFKEIVGGAFSRSKFITEKLAIPSDMVQARFGASFKVEDGNLVAKDAKGENIYSRSKPGNLAEFDEALEILVDGYSNRDSILKGTGGSGGGAGGSQGGAGGAKTMSRAAFSALAPAEQMAVSKTHQLVD